MINRVAVLLLPLVHHFVQERVEGLAPAVAPNVATADGNLGASRMTTRWCVVTEPRVHAPGHREANVFQCAAEPFEIESLVLTLQPLGDREIVVMNRCASRRTCHAGVARERVRRDDPPRNGSRGATT